MLRDDAIGLLGSFTADDDEASATRVLREGATWLRAHGARKVIGPVDRTTWHSYRFVDESTEPGRFRGEPSHPAYYPRLWRAAGARRCARYGSYWMKDPAAVRARMMSRARGVTVERTDDLKTIHEIAMRGFADAYLFAPISYQEFATLYAGAGDALAYLAIVDGAPVGFFYTFEASLDRGRVGVCKTIAVLPEARDRGAYHALFARGIGDLLERGCSHLLCALIHDDGAPRAMGWSIPEQLFRSYVLFDL